MLHRVRLFEPYHQDTDLIIKRRELAAAKGAETSVIRVSIPGDGDEPDRTLCIEISANEKVTPDNLAGQLTEALVLLLTSVLLRETTPAQDREVQEGAGARVSGARAARRAVPGFQHTEIHPHPHLTVNGTQVACNAAADLCHQDCRDSYPEDSEINCIKGPSMCSCQHEDP